ncbi:MAG: hypothetical protein WAQ33_02545 [Gaiellaceae bacterium]
MILRFLVTVLSVALLAGSSTTAQGFVGPAPVAAQDQRAITALVGPDVSSVPADASFTGKERWELALNNFTGPPLTGAQISVNSAFDLTDSNLFRFFASLQTSGGPPGPPVVVTCSINQHEAACPPSPSQTLPAGTNLFVQPNMPPPGQPPPGPPTPPWLAPGVPTAMTPGFDSTVSETAFSGGTASLHVRVTLRDTVRYTNAFQVNVHADGNAVPGSETVTSSSGGPVPVCGPSAPAGTCYRVFYGPPLCNDSRLGDGSANFFLDQPQIGETYDFGSTQAQTPTCPNPPVRPHVNVAAQQAGEPCPGGPPCSPPVTNSVTIQDPDLMGSVTYRFDEPTEIAALAPLTKWAVDYLPIFAPQRPTKIAFATNRDGNFEIYSMNADGGAQTRLTTNPAFDATPSFSADGSKIAFASSRTGNGDIYLMNADGTGQARLTTSTAIDGFPTFSPDGTKIAFASSRTGNGDIYVMNADGTGQTRLTTSAAVDAEPSWSPDGKRIVFTSGRTANGDIYVMNADGTGQTRLTTSSAIDSSADWSTDGSKIVFDSNRDGNFEIYSMNSDGSAQTRLTNTAAFDGDPTVLSTGQIAFMSNRDGNFEIYLMNADGSSPTRRTTNPAVDVSPDAP